MKAIKSKVGITSPSQLVQGKSAHTNAVERNSEQPRTGREDSFLNPPATGAESLVTSALERLFGLFVSAYAILTKPSKWFESSLRSFAGGLIQSINFSAAFDKLYKETTSGSKQEEERKKLLKLVEWCQTTSGDISDVASTIIGRTPG